MKSKLKAVDFFCSGGGMTCGLRQAGIDVVAGIDNDPTCKETYEKNNPGSRFILADVFDLTAKDLQQELSLKKNDDDLILIGCSPCQYWTKIRTDKNKSKKSRNLLAEFKRFVNHFHPGYVLVENVPGILNRKDQSGLGRFIKDLEGSGYVVEFKIVNMNDYGVPQSRRRFSLVATRLHRSPLFPLPVNGKRAAVKDVIGVKNGFKKVHAGHRDNTPFNHTVASIIERNLKRLEKTKKDGGSWSDWRSDEELKRLKYKGGGFIDNYGRMSWNKPAPTITTRFISISNGRFAHPEENRGISIREGAALQTFPKDYDFPVGKLVLSAKIIGNAVPPLFARVLGETLVRAHSTR